MSRTASRHKWSGLWIWGSGGLADEHRNEYCYLRKTVQLSSTPASARVRVSADNRYQLFVNGRRVCFGPARCEPRLQAYDEIDLTPFLRKGKNCIAALAYHIGESTFQSLERGGWGFLLDGEIQCQRGQSIPIHTDSTWKAISAPAYNRKTTRYVVQLPFQEDFDGARDCPGWTKARFNDRDWRSAFTVTTATGLPYENLEPRGIPFEIEQPERFTAMTGSFVGRNLEGYKCADDLGGLLAEERRRSAGKTIVRNPEAALKKGRECMTVLPTPAGQFHAIVLDAGRESCGFLHFDLEAAGGEIIDFFYCEHVRPNGDAIVRAGNGALARMADRYRCGKGRQQHRFFLWKGFRYILVVFRDVRKPLKVHHLGYDFTSYPVERKGAFTSSDPLLNRIWETGVYTQQLCMHDAYMDCPWREQAQWWGDARIQWRVNMAAFGDHDLFRRGIAQGAQSQTSFGLTYGLFPCEAHGCILPDYTLVWICSIWDYYFYTGKDDPIREHFDAVVRALEWFERFAGKQYLLGNSGPEFWLFLDWAPLFKAGYSTTFTLQYLEALQTADKMARHLGRQTESRKYARIARRVKQAAVRAFWDPKGKQFFEGRRIGASKPYPQVAQHGNAYAILTDIQPKWHRQIADRIAWILKNHDQLFEKNSDGNHQRAGADYPIASSFFYGYVLEALFKAGRGDDALAGIRKLWGTMLGTGATTWYESWNHRPETYGNTSACHAWSASPTYHLSERIGGVMPTAPGFEKVRITPNLFDLDHASVRTPTPRGPIDVQLQRTDKQEVDLTIKLPKRVAGLLELPGRRGQVLEGGTHRMTTKS